MRKWFIAGLCLSMSLAAADFGEFTENIKPVELEFQEKFAWSTKREVQLKNLVPLSQNYFYYHILCH